MLPLVEPLGHKEPNCYHYVPSPSVAIRPDGDSVSQKTVKDQFCIGFFYQIPELHLLLFPLSAVHAPNDMFFTKPEWFLSLTLED